MLRASLWKDDMLSFMEPVYLIPKEIYLNILQEGHRSTRSFGLSTARGRARFLKARSTLSACSVLVLMPCFFNGVQLKSAIKLRSYKGLLNTVRLHSWPNLCLLTHKPPIDSEGMSNLLGIFPFPFTCLRERID